MRRYVTSVSEIVKTHGGDLITGLCIFSMVNYYISSASNEGYVVEMET